jgi:hypothetical protein
MDHNRARDSEHGLKNKPTNGIRPTRLYRPKARSKITNGRTVLPGIDGRTIWPRRFRDLQAQLISDLGGDDHVSTAKRSIVRRACVLMVELELRELDFVSTAPSYQHLEQYSRIASNLRRMLEALGLERVAKDITPSNPLDYANGLHQNRRVHSEYVTKQRREALDET